MRTIRPQSGAQEAFLSTPADIAIYGGAAGGGKSFALLLEPLRHVSTVDGFGAVIFRRTSPQVRNEGGLWDESANLYPLLDATPRESVLEWVFPPFSNRVKFAHLEHEKNVFDWQGSQIALIGFDELTHFTERQFWYMLSRNRSACGVSPYIRAGTNPHPDSWVRRLLDWWIGPDGFPIPERSGAVRWFVRSGDDMVWADDPAELTTAVPGSLPKSFTFVPSRLEDNRILMERDPSYLANLMALDRVERARLHGGNWNIRDAAGELFKREWFQTIPGAPADVKRWVRYWDRAATEPGEQNRDPDWTVGVLMGLRANGTVVIADIARTRQTPAGVEAFIKRTTESDADLPEYVSWQQTDPGQAGKVEAHHLSLALAGYNVRFDPVPKVAKVERVKPFSAQAEAGNVALVAGSWNDAFLSEAEAFPHGAHDDQMDAAGGAYDKLHAPSVALPVRRSTVRSNSR